MNHVEPVQERETALNIKSILVAADLSSHSDRTVAYALSIARQFGASLKLIHIYAPPASIAFGTEDIYRLLENDRKNAERRLTNLAGSNASLFL